MKMIKLSETHYVVVDDSEIKRSDYCLSVKDKFGIMEDSFMKKLSPFRAEKDLGKVNFAKKITHSSELLEIQKMNSLGSHFVFVKIKNFLYQK